MQGMSTPNPDPRPSDFSVSDLPFAGKKLLVAVGGGIAAYKTATLVSRLVQGGAEVQVVMTAAAAEFIGGATFAALSGRPVCNSIFAADHYPLGPHIELATNRDLMIVAPATADLLAKFSQGFSDSLVSALYLQIECPVLLAPAMSTPMWQKASVQRNVRQIIDDGAVVVGPEKGWLSCRQLGEGRMSEPETILQRAAELLDVSSAGATHRDR